MSLPTVVSIAAAGEFIVFAFIVLVFVREKRALHAFVSHAKDASAFEVVATRLPSRMWEIGSAFARTARNPALRDAALARAMTDIAASGLGRTNANTAIVGVLLVIVALLPASWAELALAEQATEAWRIARDLGPGARLVRVRAMLDAPFGELHAAFAWSAALTAGALWIGAIHTWLGGASARRERLLEALLEAHRLLAADEASGLAIALRAAAFPSRGIRSVFASVTASFALVAAGCAVLIGTSDLRARNAHEPVFDAWPTKHRRAIEPKAGLLLPTAVGGVPLTEPFPPTFEIGPTEITFKTLRVSSLDDGALPLDWQANFPDLEGAFAEHRRDGMDRDVLVLAHADVVTGNIAELIEYLRNTNGIERFHLVLQRGPMRDPSAPRAQARLTVDARRTERMPNDLAVRFDGRALRVGAEDIVDLDGEGWKSALRRSVRRKPELWESEPRGAVRVSGHREVSYQRVIEVLAAMDTTCRSGSECGLPGLGLAFVLE